MTMAKLQVKEAPQVWKFDEISPCAYMVFVKMGGFLHVMYWKSSHLTEILLFEVIF
jgi:hypothetical protein